MENPAPLQRGGRIIEFEGLRGYLAWWVVLFHFVVRSKIQPTSLSAVEDRIANGGWEAVEIFIILSGFVITWLLESQKESYGVFIVRRFFRLAPVYYVLLAYAAVVAALRGTYGNQLWKHVLLHLSFLHGMIPDEILMKSDTALCVPAWSLSVEWQFYLIAPLILPLIRSSGAKAIGMLLASIVLSKVLLHYGTYEFRAWVIMRAALFGVGIGSYYFFQVVTSRRAASRGFAEFLFPAAFALSWVFFKTADVGVLWLLIFTAVLTRHAGAETWLTRPITYLLDRPLATWLGKLSYCTYLCHDYVLDVITATLGPWLSTLSDRLHLLIYMGICTPLILVLSAALHTLVENPGIQLGKRVSRWWLSVPPRAAPPLPDLEPSRAEV